MPSGVYKRTITHKHSEETKKKISESKKGHSYNIGRKLSEETKQKISQSLMGKYIGKNNPNFGRHHSEEAKRIIGLTHKGKTLSKKHRAILSKVNWKGGRYIIDGYMRVYVGNGIYIFEHRLVMEKMIGRKLKPEERVHHINGNTLDNRPENLLLFENMGKHTKFHEDLKKQIKKSRQLELSIA